HAVPAGTDRDPGCTLRCSTRTHIGDYSGEQGDDLATITCMRVWERARKKAWRYDLRHAVVSSCLTAGVAPTRIAKWDEHHVEVPLTVHGKCLDGRVVSQRAATNQRTRSEVLVLVLLDGRREFR